jgi:hypothetical protein
MADGVFNIAKGAVAEKIRDGASAILVMLLKVSEAAATLGDRATVAAILAASNTECNFTNYVRKTGITGTITVDNVNDRVDCDIPDQVWSVAGGAVNNTTTKLIIAYQESAADSGRIPLTHHDFVITTDTSNVNAELNAAGFFRAQ